MHISFLSKRYWVWIRHLHSSTSIKFYSIIILHTINSFTNLWFIFIISRQYMKFDESCLINGLLVGLWDRTNYMYILVFAKRLLSNSRQPETGHIFLELPLLKKQTNEVSWIIYISLLTSLYINQQLKKSFLKRKKMHLKKYIFRNFS